MNRKPEPNPPRSLLTAWLIAGLLLISVVFGYKSIQAQSEKPEDWGTLITPGVPTNYDIYTQNFSYAEPFLITDMRSSDANPLERYDMHTLDIYRPADGAELLENRPVVFFVHGGGWTDGYKRRFESVSWSFTGQKGWITVVIDYRLTSYDAFIADQYCPDRATCGLPENQTLRTKAAQYPDNIQDVADAFDWTHESIAQQGGNPDRIYGLGYSAGAHLITLMAMHPDYTHLRYGLRAVAALSGPYDLVDSDFKSAYLNVLRPTFGRPLDNVELADASPQTQISSVEWLPPFMLLYAEHDLIYFDAQTLNLTESIQEKGLPVEIVYLEGFSHESEMGALRFIDQYPTEKVVELFESLLPYRSFLPFIP